MEREKRRRGETVIGEEMNAKARKGENAALFTCHCEEQSDKAIW